MAGSPKLRRWRPIASLAGGLALALALAACGPAAGNTARTSGAGSIERGGTLTIMAGAPVTSWDPATNLNTIPGVAADRFNAIYGPLVDTNSQGKVQGGMAEGLTTQNNITWILKLHPGIKFTDGTPYDAAAVKYNWDRIAAPGSGAVSQAFAATFASKVVNATTLSITLQKADPTFAFRVAELLSFIASPKSLKAEGSSYTKPVGAGAFMLSSWQQGVQETLVRNPHYWQTGKPYLDKIIFKYVEDPAQRVATVTQGGAQLMNGYLFQFSKQAADPGMATYRVPAGGLRIFYFNTKRAPFNDVRARQAVQLATNATELVQTLTQETNVHGAGTLFPPTSPYYNKALALPAQDMAAAQKLVNQLKAAGKPMTFTIAAAAVPELERSAQLLQLMLNKLHGVKASVKVVALADWAANTFTQHNFDITFYPGIFDLNSAPVQLTDLLGTAGSGNAEQYSSTAMDQALYQVRQSVANPSAETAAFAKVQQVYRQDLPLVVFGIDYRTFLHASDVAGFNPMGSGSLLMQDLHLTK